MGSRLWNWVLVAAAISGAIAFLQAVWGLGARLIPWLANTGYPFLDKAFALPGLGGLLLQLSVVGLSVSMLLMVKVIDARDKRIADLERELKFK